jgi:GntR family transcriptional regulator, galactonate operon transcriptional repressor
MSDMLKSHAHSPAIVPANPSESLFKQVTDKIAISILSGDLEAGALVPTEPDPRSGIAPSRSVYREALKYLSAKGLIEARQRSGTRVSPRSSWNLLDPDILRWALAGRIDEEFVNNLFELRLFIEPNAARLAAIRRTPQQLHRIRHALTGLENNLPYTDAIIQADLNYHSFILDAAGNPALSCLKSVIMSTLLWSMRLQRNKQPEQFSVALADHQRVYRAIEEQNGDQAAAFMTSLVSDGLHDTLTAFRTAAIGSMHRTTTN